MRTLTTFIGLVFAATGGCAAATAGDETSDQPGHKTDSVSPAGEFTFSVRRLSYEACAADCEMSVVLRSNGKTYDLGAWQGRSPKGLSGLPISRIPLSELSGLTAHVTYQTVTEEVALSWNHEHMLLTGYGEYESLLAMRVISNETRTVSLVNNCLSSEQFRIGDLEPKNLQPGEHGTFELHVGDQVHVMEWTSPTPGLLSYQVVQPNGAVEFGGRDCSWDLRLNQVRLPWNIDNLDGNVTATLTSVGSDPELGDYWVPEYLRETSSVGLQTQHGTIVWNDEALYRGGVGAYEDLYVELWSNYQNTRTRVLLSECSVIISDDYFEPASDRTLSAHTSCSNDYQLEWALVPSQR